MKLILENVRSFDGRHEVGIKPLTIITGENSSGKSTLLALLSAVSDDRTFPFRPSLNDPPYNMGGYDTIATYKGGRYGRADSFSLGYRTADPANNLETIAQYTSRSGEVFLSCFAAKKTDFDMKVTFDSKKTILTGSLEMHYQGNHYETSFELPREVSRTTSLTVYDILYFVVSPRSEASDRLDVAKLVGPLSELANSMRNSRALSLSPIRMQPQRIFSTVGETFDPSGQHIPYILERLESGEIAAREQTRVLTALQKFGSESGLFSNLIVKRLGKKVSDPFQIMIEGEGRPANLVDVGYGISQVIPVIVQSALVNPNGTLLMQQPEIHLHPKAQAAMGSYFAWLARPDRHYVIETHSDYLIDRIRWEIAEGRLKSDLVSIVFCERLGMESRTYELSLDEKGNIYDAPEGYRSFFLEEEYKLL